MHEEPSVRQDLERAQAQLPEATAAPVPVNDGSLSDDVLDMVAGGEIDPTMSDPYLQEHDPRSGW